MSQASQAKYDMINGPDTTAAVNDAQDVLDAHAAQTTGKSLAEQSGGIDPAALAARRAGKSTVGNWWADNVKPVTDQFMQGGVGGLQGLYSAYQSGGNPITGALDAMRSQPGPVAQALNPYQSPTSTGIALGAGATGGAAGLLNRLAGPTAGGAIGGTVDTGTPEGGLLGGAQGLVAGVIGEGVRGAANLGKRVWDGGKSAVDAFRAQGTGKAMGSIPRLQGAFGEMPGTGKPPQTADDLWQLAHGVDAEGRNLGESLLGKQMDIAEAKIKNAIGDKATQPLFPDPMAPKAKVEEAADPVLKAFTDQYRRAMGFRPDQTLSQVEQDAVKNMVRQANPQWVEQTGSKGSGFVDLDTAMHNLSKLRDRMNAATGVDRYDLGQQYEEAKRLIQQQLSKYDTSGQAAKMFGDKAAMYKAGMYLLEAVRKGFSGGGEFNSDPMVRWLNVNNPEGVQALGADGMSMLRQLAGLPPGKADVAGQTAAAHAVRALGHASGLARVTSPLAGNIGTTQFAGPQWSLSPGTQTGVQIGGTAAAGGVLDPFTRDLLRSTGR